MLLLDVMRGDATLFIRSDEAEAQWRLITPIEEAWASQNCQQLPVTPPAATAHAKLTNAGAKRPPLAEIDRTSHAGCDYEIR